MPEQDLFFVGVLQHGRQISRSRLTRVLQHKHPHVLRFGRQSQAHHAFPTQAFRRPEGLLRIRGVALDRQVGVSGQVLLAEVPRGDLPMDGRQLRQDRHPQHPVHGRIEIDRLTGTPNATRRVWEGLPSAELCTWGPEPSCRPTHTVW
jgi:hypothetical protein